MLWFRHWLELRHIFWVALSLTLVMAAPFALVARLAVLPSAVHVQFTTFLAIAIPFTLFGSGYSSQQRSGFVGPGHPSVYFTLSLPVSRFHIVSTRLVAGFAAMTGVFGISLVAHAAALLALGRPVPIGSMAATTLLATIPGGAVLAVFGLLSVALKEMWAGLIALPLMLLLLFRGWNGVMDFLASEQPPWAAIAGLLAVSGAAFGATVFAARTKEF